MLPYCSLEVIGAEQTASHAAVKSPVYVLLLTTGAGVRYRYPLVAHISPVVVPDTGEAHRRQVLVAEQLDHFLRKDANLYRCVPLVVVTGDGYAASRRHYLPGNLHSGHAAADDEGGPFFLKTHLGVLALVGADGSQIYVSLVAHAVGFQNGMPSILLRQENCHIRKKVLALPTPFLERYLACGGVHHCVAGAFQPGLGLLLKRLKVSIRSVRQEILLHVLHAVLHLAFRLRIRRTTEYRPERTAPDISVEHLRHYVVADVLVPQEHRVLIVDDFLGDAVKVLERLFVGSHGCLESEGMVLEPDVLVTASAKQHCHEVHLLVRSVAFPQFLLAEVNLCVLP